LLKRSYEVTKEPLSGLRAAVLADSLDDASTRDSLLAQVAEVDRAAAKQRSGQSKLQEENAACYREVASTLLAAAGDSKPLDLTRIDTALSKAMPGQPTYLYYLVGTFLQKHGDSEKSKIYLMRSATSPRYHTYIRTLAISALRDRKILIDLPRDEEIAK
jgi:hypothetical protein